MRTLSRYSIQCWLLCAMPKRSQDNTFQNNIHFILLGQRYFIVTGHMKALDVCEDILVDNVSWTWNIFVWIVVLLFSSATEIVKCRVSMDCQQASSEHQQKNIPLHGKSPLFTGWIPPVHCLYLPCSLMDTHAHQWTVRSKKWNSFITQILYWVKLIC